MDHAQRDQRGSGDGKGRTVNKDAIPEILYPNPKNSDRYIVINSTYDTESFADALVTAEGYCRSSPLHPWAIYRLDTTVELINGVIVVMRYRAFKDRVRALNVMIPEEGGAVIFRLPMPASWSKIKKARYVGHQHQSKPDLDNMLKALLDAAFDEDCKIWSIKVVKLWDYEPSIEVIG